MPMPGTRSRSPIPVVTNDLPTIADDGDLGMPIWEDSVRQEVAFPLGFPHPERLAS
jgi:hypothetical protein